MRYSKEEQDQFLHELLHDFQVSKRFLQDAFVGWDFYPNFDRHSPCKNMAIITPNDSEIRIYVPNSRRENLNQEKFNTYGVAFNIYGAAHLGAELHEEFDSPEDVVGYLYEQYINDNL